MITSAANPKIRSLRALHDRRHREETGRFLIEGLREVRMALSNGVAVETLVASPESALHLPAGVPVLWVSDDLMERIGYRGEVLAVAETFTTDLGRIPPDPRALILVIEGVEKPGNLGAMLRTADACQASVLVCDPHLDIFNPNVIRASLGALFSVPLAVGTAEEAAAFLARLPAAVVTTLIDAPTPYWEIDFTGPVAVVVGSEAAGLSTMWRSRSRPVRIPMRGGVDSLNASVAAAVVLFEAVRQRATQPRTLDSAPSKGG